MEEPRPDLVRAAAQGDVAAFEQIVRLFEVHVWRFLRHLLRDGSLAEDVAQETFLRVHRHLGGFANESKFSTWVFRIARNAAVDELRKGARRARLVEALPPPSAPPGPELRVEIEHAVGALPDRLREALLAVRVLGLSYRDAADVLGVPEGTVKSRVFHARLALSAWMDEGRVADEV